MRSSWFDSGVRNNCDLPLSYLQQLGVHDVDYHVASHSHDDHVGCADGSPRRPIHYGKPPLTEVGAIPRVPTADMKRVYVPSPYCHA